MNIENMIEAALNFISVHPYATGAILAIAGVFSYFKLKIVLKAVIACLIFGAIVYVVLFFVNLASTGMENTEKLLANPNQVVDKLKK
ncbi:MAG: hypothetical protein OEM48_01505 [Gammaproteobacteria bacterium]|nr:hypothetical protein [Gammaproteobacteria bacterium]MDH5486579.1 hypothetical protein [Gammaproteobacteria bacterium]